MEKKRSKLWKAISMIIIFAMVFTTAMPQMTYAKSNVVTPRITSVSSTKTTVTVKWTRSKNATGYMVYRAFNNGNKYTKVRTLKGVNSTSFKNCNLKAGSKYKYKIRAYRKVNNRFVYSGYSPYRTIRTKSAVPKLGAPCITNSTATASSVTLNWLNVANAEGYQIYRAEGGNNRYEYLDTISGGKINTYTDRNVSRNTTYYYKLNAFAGQNENVRYSDFSEYEIVTTLDEDVVPVEKPQILGGSSTENSATVNWRPSNDVDGYVVYRAKAANGSYAEIGTIEDNGTSSYVDEGLQSGTTYYYKVKAYKNVNGRKQYSDFSDYKRITTEKSIEVVLDAPVINNFSATETSATIEWNRVAGAEGYVVYRAKAANGSYSEIGTIKNNGTSSYVDNGLQSGTAYYYKVKAYKNVNGGKQYSDFSEYKKVTTLKKVEVVLDAPYINHASATETRVSIKWDMVNGADGYDVYKLVDNDVWAWLESVSGTSYYDPGLDSGTTYKYKIRAYKEVNGNTYYSEFSNIKTVTTEQEYVEPFDVTVWLSDWTEEDTDMISGFITNNTNKPMVLENYGMLSDNDYYDYDRDLSLGAWSEEDEDAEIHFADTVVIMPYQKIWFSYDVIGPSTWYDEFSTLGMVVKYNGKEYAVLASSFYGTEYELMDNISTANNMSTTRNCLKRTVKSR